MSFNETTMNLEDRNLRPGSKKRARLSNQLFKIDDETKLLVEIMGIQDELNIVNSVLEYQNEVLLQLSRIYLTAQEKANAAKEKANAAKEKADDGKKTVHFDIQDSDDVSRPADLIWYTLSWWQQERKPPPERIRSTRWVLRDCRCPHEESSFDASLCRKSGSRGDYSNQRDKRRPNWILDQKSHQP